MVKNKESAVKKAAKNTEIPKGEVSGETSKGSAEPAPQSEKASTTARNDEQRETKTSEGKNYVRGESQKPVTKAYRDSWNRIFK